MPLMMATIRAKERIPRRRNLSWIKTKRKLRKTTTRLVTLAPMISPRKKKKKKQNQAMISDWEIKIDHGHRRVAIKSATIVPGTEIEMGIQTGIVETEIIIANVLLKMATVARNERTETDLVLVLLNVEEVQKRVEMVIIVIEGIEKIRNENEIENDAPITMISEIGIDVPGTNIKITTTIGWEKVMILAWVVVVDLHLHSRCAEEVTLGIVLAANMVDRIIVLHEVTLVPTVPAAVASEVLHEVVVGVQGAFTVPPVILLLVVVAIEVPHIHTAEGPVVLRVVIILLLAVAIVTEVVDETEIDAKY